MRTKEADDDAFSTSKKRPLRKRAKAVPSFARRFSPFSFSSSSLFFPSF
jgi:hypothetical protein